MTTQDTTPVTDTTDPFDPTSEDWANPTTMAELEALYPGVPREALEVFIRVYVEKGTDAAWAAVRQDPRYDEWFPGNMTADGTVRYSESNYGTAVAQYEDVFRSVGIENVGLFRDQITRLMEGEVSPTEFRQRVTQVYERVISASDEIKQYYADMYGLSDLTTPALLAAALDPSVGDLILTDQIAAAEIGGEAMEAGFAMSLEDVEMLRDHDMTKAQADELFNRARQLVPIMDVLARRHYDPDDDFDINEFLQAEFFADPQENFRMRRLINQERALFSASGDFARDRYGGVSGLLAD